jgi:hypothetical protein
MGNYILNTKVVSFSEMWGGGVYSYIHKPTRTGIKNTHTQHTVAIG